MLTLYRNTIALLSHFMFIWNFQQRNVQHENTSSIYRYHKVMVLFEKNFLSSFYAAQHLSVQKVCCETYFLNILWIYFIFYHLKKKKKCTGEKLDDKRYTIARDFTDSLEVFYFWYQWLSKSLLCTPCYWQNQPKYRVGIFQTTRYFYQFNARKLSNVYFGHVDVDVYFVCFHKKSFLLLKFNGPARPTHFCAFTLWCKAILAHASNRYHQHIYRKLLFNLKIK